MDSVKRIKITTGALAVTAPPLVQLHKDILIAMLPFMDIPTLLVSPFNAVSKCESKALNSKL